MANTLKFGNGQWAVKESSALAYNDENGNFKPLPFTFVRDSGATRVNKEGLIEVVSNNEPRIDFKDSSEGSLLLEPSRSNLVTYSEDFTQWSFKTGVSALSNEIISVDGNLNGSKIETTANGSRYVGNNYTLSTGDNTFSVFAKKGINNWIYLNVVKDGTNNWNYTFDLDNGLIGQSNSSAYSTTAKIEDYGNGWYRCSISANVTTAGVFTARIYCADSASDVNTIVGSNVYIYGAQLEQGSYATSYIPTSGGVVTRSADVCVGAGNEQVFNDNEGVLMAEISALDEKAGTRYVYIGNGTTANRVVIRYSTTENDIRMLVTSGGSTQVSSGTTNYNITENHKIALKYKVNDFALWIDGVEVLTDTNGSTPTGINQLTLSYSGTQFYGNTKQIKYFNTALSDEELAALTKI